MNASLNIVELIENNPITRLKGDYKNNLIIKIQNLFTDSQQQLFLSSFYCYLNYNQTEDFVIDLDNIWKWLGFQQKYNAKVVLEKNFILDKDYKISLMNTQVQKKDQRGGHNKQTIMMTIKTFKLLCIKSETKKADEIHNYFVKLEELLHITLEEQHDEIQQQFEQEKKEKNQIKNELEQIQNNFEEKLKKEKVLQKEQFLLDKFSSVSSIVYVIKVKSFENKNYIVKIGESRLGITSRYAEHKRHYPECILLDCYSVIKSKEFENFIHSHEKIRPNKVKNFEGHERENELFLIGNNLTYKILTKVIEDHIKKFNEYTKKDFDLLQAKYDLLQSKNDSMQSKYDLLQLKYDSLEEKYIRLNQQILTNQPIQQNILLEQPNNQLINKLQTQVEEIHKLQIKVEEIHKLQTQSDDIRKLQERVEEMQQLQQKNANPPQNILTGFQQLNQTVGPRLQKINPETLALIQVYETVSEALNESKHIWKRPSIQKAIVENTVYQGFRWAYKDRNEDPQVVDIPPTRPVQVQSVGYIAKMNADKTEIVQVYIDRKTACFQNGYTSAAALDIPVKKDKPVHGFYYMLFDKCPDNLQEKFIQQRGVPLLYKDGVGQFDPHGNLLQEFSCKYDCIKKLQMSDKTLAKTLDKNVPYNHCYYRRMPEKLSC